LIILNMIQSSIARPARHAAPGVLLMVTCWKPAEVS
jgi:hypothetical protein